MSSKTTALIVAAMLFAASAVSASPIGDDYFFSGVNFPVTFGPSGPLTFNNTGDTTPESIPGSGLAGGIDIVEQVNGTTPSGSEILRFAFFFNQAPLDINQGFGFTISGLEWGGFGVPGGLEASSIDVIFGVGNTFANVTLFTTVTNLPGGTSIAFATPSGTSWSSFFGGQTPTSLTVDFQAAIQHAPEPSTLALFGLGLFAAARSRRRR